MKSSGDEARKRIPPNGLLGALVGMLMLAGCGGGDATDTTDAATGDAQKEASESAETETAAEETSSTTTAETTTTTAETTTTVAETTTTEPTPTDAESVAVRIVTADDPETDYSQDTQLNLYPAFLAESLPLMIRYVDPDRVISDSQVPLTMLIELPEGTAVEGGTAVVDQDVVIEELLSIGAEPVATGEVVGVGADREAIVSVPYAAVFGIVFDTQDDQVEQIERLDAMLEPALADIVAALEATG